MRLVFIALVSAISFSSCHYIMGERIQGNGNVATREENVGSFNSLDVGGAIEVHIRQDQTPSVKIETDENLMEFLEVFTEGNTLVIRTRQGYNLDPSKGVVAYVSAPAYKNIEVSGASKLVGENTISGNGELNISASGASKITMEVDGQKLTGDASGASTVILKGQVSNIDVEASGASHINGYDLVTDDAIIGVSGASSAKITANKTLKADASGASSIRYKGNANVNQSTSGASSVSRE